MATLNLGQRLFLHYYVGDAKGDEVKAAKMAGYTRPEVMGPRLLNSKHVVAELAKQLEESGAMTPPEILARLSTIASLDVMEFVDFREETNRAGETVEKPVLDLKKVKKLRKGNLIKDLKVHPSGAVEVKFHDAVEAMDKLAKYHGMFVQKVDVTVHNDNASNDRIAAILSGFAELAGAVVAGAIDSSPEPGGLCGGGECWEVEGGQAPPTDQPTLALGGPEGDRPPGDHARPENGQVGVHLEVLSGVDGRPEA